MKKTLYLLRKPIDQIDPALFLPAKSQGDVILLEESGGRMFPNTGGAILSFASFLVHVYLNCMLSIVRLTNE